MIKEKLELIKHRKLSAEENIKKFLEVIEKKKKINAVLYVNPKTLEEAKEVDLKIRNEKAGRLAGLGFVVKANINVEGMPISCASKTLEEYYGTYDADVIKKLKAEDAIVLGIANCDCFACGASGENSMFGATDNPAAPGHVPGGSSSGSAAAVAAEMCDFALGSDTGGSIRNPASHCGVVGIKPSYGRVSRYGLVDMAMSLDQIGPLCTDVYGAALVMEIISGYSEYDAISIDKPIQHYTKFKKEKLKIGIVKEFDKLCTDKRISKLINECIEKIAKGTGSSVKDIELKHIDLGIQTYYPIVYVEVFSSTRKFDGRKYGKKIEESCSEEVLRRILGGKEISKAEHHGKYYRKALQVKKLISAELEKAFKEVDVIITPVTPRLPHKVGEKITIKDMYGYDAFTIPANLSGICAGVINAGSIDNIPVGLQVMAPAFREDLMFDVLKVWEDLK